jgi:hypothetical protein
MFLFFVVWRALISCHTNRVLCTRLQVQRSKHWRDLEFLAFSRKFKPPVARLLVDVWATPSVVTLTVEALLQNPTPPCQHINLVNQYQSGETFFQVYIYHRSRNECFYGFHKLREPVTDSADKNKVSGSKLMAGHPNL